MAQIDYRANLNDTSFPMLTQNIGRTVLVSNFKEAPTGESPDSPQIYYMHNVMPVSTGVVSVGYDEVIPAVVGVDATDLFDDVRIIFSEVGSRVHLGMTTDGHVYTLELGDTVWRHIDSHPALGSDFTTLGFVNGVTYIHLKDVGTFTYNDVTHLFTPVTLTGLGSGIIGITGSSGYLIAYTTRALAWSSTIDPTDFVTSTTTGAGGGAVSDLEGDIIFVVPNALGLLVYTFANVVAATYTSNLQFPFRFKGVNDSKGAIGLDFVAYEANSGSHFAFTKGGLQEINSRIAKPIAPEVTDFLAGKQFEDFDEVTKLFTVTDLTTTMKKKVKLIGSRYLIVSYGITEFTHALIFDIALTKFGKIKFTHTDVFEYIGAQTEISRETIAFLSKDGSINTLQFSVPTASRTGVLILGKYQYKRGKFITIHSVVAENVAQSDDFSLTLLTTLDGRNTTQTIPTEVAGTVGYRQYFSRTTGWNHSLVFIGKFNLTTIELIYAINGNR